ncbi:MAG TPA: AQJ64_40280 family protein [Actinospica sp.]|jgi:hypothetical protein|nr:AQJ64_40280 family protein [Actinospica sp.]
MDAVVKWVDARERLPRDGMPVAAAATGRYPAYRYAEPDDTYSGQKFWVVLPVRFAAHHVGADGTEYDDCFIDSDGIVRVPYGRPCSEPITHWAYLPTLPGLAVHALVGEDVSAAVQDALG